MKKIVLFDDRIFYRNLFTLAVPIMLQNLINAFVNVVDTVMIGQLGAVEIAGVGLGNQVFFLLNMLLFGISSGGAVFTAQFWGKKDIIGIRKTTGFCFTLALIVSGVFTAVCMTMPRFIIGLYSKDAAVIDVGSEYLRTVAGCFMPFAVSFVLTLVMRSIEKVNLSMATTFISLSINVFCNWLFIFGIGPFPAMGATGAAVGTVIARGAELIILLTVSYGRKYAFAGTIRELFSFDALFIKRFFQIAFPVMVNEVLWSLGVTMQNVIFARTNTDAIAAFNIVNTVAQLTWVFFIGLGNGCSVLIGKKIGEGCNDTARDYARRITRFSPMLAGFVALLLIPIGYGLPFFFKVNDHVFSIIFNMIVILIISYPFRAFNMSMIIGVCRAGGDTVFSVMYDVLIMWTIALPLAAISSFVFHASAWIVYLCLSIEDPLKMTFGILRLKSGKWLRNVT